MKCNQQASGQIGFRNRKQNDKRKQSLTVFENILSREIEQNLLNLRSSQFIGQYFTILKNKYRWQLSL